MKTEEMIEKIETLENKVKMMQERIEQLSMSMANMPSRFEVDSLLKQQQNGSIFDIFG